MYDYVNDPVDVTVDFSWPRVRPKKIRWNNRDYILERVNLIHATHEGDKKLYYFSVSDRTNLFKLRFESDTLEWRLVEIYHE